MSLITFMVMVTASFANTSLTELEPSLSDVVIVNDDVVKNVVAYVNAEKTFTGVKISNNALAESFDLVMYGSYLTVTALGYDSYASDLIHDGGRSPPERAFINLLT